MRIIETKVYLFEELNEEAKEKARNWYREASYDDISFAYDNTKEDAKQIGLKITELHEHSANKGEFIESAFKCAKKIIEEHGESCDTYKTAKAFLAKIKPEPLDGETAEWEEEREEQEEEFLHAILEDYRVYLRNDIEYRDSNDYIDENIIVNEYTFTQNGKRFG